MVVSENVLPYASRADLNVSELVADSTREKIEQKLLGVCEILSFLMARAYCEGL